MKNAPTTNSNESARQGNFNTRSTATAVQLAKLKMFLRTRPHHTHELRAKGISHPAGRVRDLIKMGYMIEPGRLMRCKTDDDKGLQKSGWYRVFDDTDLMTCVYGDWRQDSRHVWVSGNRPQSAESRAAAQRLIDKAKAERRQAQLAQWVQNHAKLMTLWNSVAVLSDDDPAGQYLINRGLAVPGAGVLRYHAGLDYWLDGQCIGRFPAMLAAVSSPTGELITVHRTYLTPDGQKAPVPTVTPEHRTGARGRYVRHGGNASRSGARPAKRVC